MTSRLASPRIVPYDGATVVGLGITTSNGAEIDAATGQIPGLWTRFYRDDIIGLTPRKKDPPVPLGVYTNYESDHTGRYDLVIGVAVDPDAPIPAGFVRAAVPPGRYLLFEGTGELPNVVFDLWAAVWRYFSEPGSGHVRAYTTDFEVYPSEGIVQIHVSIR